MKLKIPFVYHADAIPPGRRKVSRTAFAAELEVEVPSVSSSEATTVATWDHPDRYWDGQTSGGVRMFGNRLYSQRMVWDDSLCEYVGVHPANLTVADVMVPDMFEDGDEDVLLRFSETGTSLTPDMCKSVISSEREATEEYLIEKFAGLLVVDGHVWEPCMAPVVVLDFAHSRENALRAEATVFTDMRRCRQFIDRLPREWYEEAILLDRARPELLEGLRRIVSERDVPYLPVFTMDDIPPDLCERRFEVDIISFARAALGALPKPLQLFDDRSISSWLALRQASDALEAVMQAGGDVDVVIDDILDGIEDVVHMTEGKAAFRLDIVRRVWDAREIAPRLQNPEPSAPGFR